MKKSDLTTMTATELKALARKKNIPLPSGAKKAEIVAALLAQGGAPREEKPAKAAAGKASPEKSVDVSPQKRTTTAKTATVKRPRRAPEGEPVKPRERWDMPAGVEEPLMAQERVENAKYYTGPGQPAPAAGAYAELPVSYGEDRIAIMVKDPSVAFAYWEVTPARLEREKAWFGWDSKLCIRIYDVTGVQFDGTNALGYFDQEIAERVGNWYFETGRPNHSFCADIGLLASTGRFLTLARSNYVTMPRDGVSDVVDEEWMITEEEFWKIYGVPGGLSSQEMSEFWRQRRMHGISSPGMSGRERGKGKHRA